MNARIWMTVGLLAALWLAVPAALQAADEDFSELLKPLKPASPILPPVEGCAACQKLGHICPVCKEQALKALAEGKPLPTEPPKVLPDENPSPPMPGQGGAPGGSNNPLVPVAKMMKEVEDLLKGLADKRAVATHQEVIDAIDKQLADALAKQKELASKLKTGMDEGQDGQKKILEYLDALIAQAEQQQQQQQGGGGGGGGGGGQQQGQSGSGPPSGTQQPSSPAQVSALVEGGDAGIGALDDVQRGSGERFFAQLPARQREAIIAAFREQFPDNWREQLERYYRALGELRRRSAENQP